MGDVETGGTTVDAGLNGQALSEELLSAIRNHREQVSDPAARFNTQPLPAFDAARQVDAMGWVTGYRQVSKASIANKTSEQVRQLLADRLTDLPIRDVEFEVVWSLGEVAVVYVRGKEHKPDV